MKKFNRITTFPYLFVLIVFIILPTLMIIFESFKYDNVFSFQALYEIFKTPSYLKSFYKSIVYAASVTGVSILIGYPVSLVIWKIKKRYQYLVLSLLMLQMWINLVARVRAIKYMLKFIKLDNTFWGSIFAGVYIFIPFLILALVTQLNKIDDSLLEAGKDLGAKKIHRFSKIIFPLSLPGLISGISLVFFPAATTVVIPLLVNNKWTIGNLIESLSVGSNKPIAYAMAMIIMIALLLFIWLIEKTNNKYEMEKDHA